MAATGRKWRKETLVGNERIPGILDVSFLISQFVAVRFWKMQIVFSLLLFSERVSGTSDSPLSFVSCLCLCCWGW